MFNKQVLLLLLFFIIIIVLLLNGNRAYAASGPNLALNPSGVGFPVASSSPPCCEDNASYTTNGLFGYQESPHDRWTNYGMGNTPAWVAINFGTATTFNQVKLYIYNDGGGVKPPASYTVQYLNGETWMDTTNQDKFPTEPEAALNSVATKETTLNTVDFDTVVSNQLRVVFTNGAAYSGIVELEVFNYELEDGTPEHPYVISTTSDFQLMRDNLNSSFVLANNIELSGQWTPIGEGSASPFNGKLDGQGYRITGLTFENSGSSYVGLFSAIGPSGAIENLTIEGAAVTGHEFVGVLAGYNEGAITNINISNASVIGYSYAAGLIGQHYQPGSITNSTVSGAVYGQVYVGGMVGLHNAPITDSSTAVTVTAVQGYGGGLGGYILDTSITNSYATGNVTGVDVGGLIGNFQNSTINNSYASGLANGEQSLWGYNEDSMNIGSSWKPFIVRFDSNGGTSVSLQGIDIDGEANLPLQPTKQGYILANWYSDKELTTIYDYNSVITAHTTLYAAWTPVTYNVTFNSNGGADVESQTVNHNDTVAIPEDPYKEGYRFEGWYSDSDFMSGYYFEEPVTASIILYAKWIPTYRVSFNTNNGTDVGGQDVDADSHAYEPEPPTKDGYEFAGWYSDEGLTMIYNFEQTPVTADITLYGGWAPIVITYTVSFDNNGGSVIIDQEVGNGLIAIEPEAPARSGYAFLGWYSDSALNDEYLFSTPITGNITLYAKWESYSWAEALVQTAESYKTRNSVNDAYYVVIELTDSPKKEELLNRIEVVRNIVNHVVDITDIVQLIHGGTLEQRDVNEDGEFDSLDVHILLQRITTFK